MIDSTCADCRTTLPYQGRGRPPIRCADCQRKRRTAQWREGKRQQRKNRPPQ